MRSIPRKIRLGMAYEIGSLDPVTASSAGSLAVLPHLYDSVMHHDLADLTTLPSLAARGLERLEDGSHRLQVMQGATAVSGAAVSAKDIVASIGTFLGQAGSAVPPSLCWPLEGAVVEGPGTVHITASLPTAVVERRLSIIRVAISGDGSDPMSATGPYVVEAGDMGTRCLLRRRDNYTGRRGGGPEELEFTALVDGGLRAEALVNGEVDIIEDAADVLGIDPPVDSLNVAVRESRNVSWLMPNCGRRPFVDKRARRALAHAVDVQHLADQEPYLIPATSLLPAWDKHHVDASMRARPNVGVARGLLEQAGYPDGLRCELLVSDASWIVDQARHVVGQLAGAGIYVTTRTAPSKDFFATSVPRGDFDLVLSSGDPTPFGADGVFTLEWFLSGLWVTRNMHWFSQVRTEIAGLLGRAMAAEETADRVALLAAVQERAAEQASLIPLTHRKQVTAWRGHLPSMRPTCTPGFELTGQLRP